MTGGTSIDRRRALALLGGAALAGASDASLAAEQPRIRIAVLQFGSVAWQLETIRRHHLDDDEAIAIEAVPLASSQATLVALQAGAVDVVVSDLLWVARQRADGADWAFVPYSTALGAVDVPTDSSIRSLADLAGRRLGVAGGPLDKSWLILRLLAQRQLGRDLDGMVAASFGAPPLLGEEFRAGRLDAILTYWQFAARLEAQGARRFLGMDAALEALGVAAPVPLVGYVLSEAWAVAHRPLCEAFFRVCGRADEILLRSDEEWQVLVPSTGAADGAELARLRDGFRSGVPTGDGTQMRDAAAELYELLAAIGGEKLVGKGRHLPQGTFLGGFAS